MTTCYVDMPESLTEATSVLLAEDEAGLADLYTEWLNDDYEVSVAHDGREALKQMDESIRAVILDRRMPDLSGDAALAELRDRGYDVPVAFLSAIEPDVDLLDMECTDYLIKPADREELLNTVDRLVELSESGPAVREYYQLVAKRRALNEGQIQWQAKVPDRHDTLQSKIECLREEVDLNQTSHISLQG